METMLLMGAIGLFILASVIYSRYADAKRAELWEAQAKELSLEFDGDKLIQGQYKGMDVSIEIQSRGSGKNQYYVTVLSTYVPGAPDEMRLRREHFGTKMLKGVGMTKEHQVNDPVFDPMFLIQGPSAGRIREWLTSARKAAIMEMEGAYFECEFRSGSMNVAMKSNLTKPGEVVVALGQFVRTVTPLQDAGQLRAMLGEDAYEGKSPIERALETEDTDEEEGYKSSIELAYGSAVATPEEESQDGYEAPEVAQLSVEALRPSTSDLERPSYPMNMVLGEEEDDEEEDLW